jgi:ABC-type sugar transport system ATPase subunit
MTMADRVVLMDAGRIRQVGTPMDLYHRPADVFVAAFLGAPAMNLLAAEVRLDEAGLIVSAPGLDLRLAAGAAVSPGPATIGLRPEALERLDAGPGRIAVTGLVAHVEQLGAETLVQIALRHPTETLITARIPGGWPVRAKDAVSLSATISSLHLFDAAGVAVAGACPDFASAAPARLVEA